MYLYVKRWISRDRRMHRQQESQPVYQHPTSYPDLTVAENIFMGHEIVKNQDDPVESDEQ